MATSSWITFQGKFVSFYDIDHQHLSNIVWFSRVFWGEENEDAKLFLSSRFNGQLLPYRPHVDFKREISILHSKKMLVNSDFGYNIVWNGKLIGELRFTDYFSVVEKTKPVLGNLSQLAFELTQLRGKDHAGKGTEVFFTNPNQNTWWKKDKLEVGKSYIIENFRTYSHHDNNGIELEGYTYTHDITQFSVKKPKSWNEKRVIELLVKYQEYIAKFQIGMRGKDLLLPEEWFHQNK